MNTKNFDFVSKTGKKEKKDFNELMNCKPISGLYNTMQGFNNKTTNISPRA